MKNKLQKGFTLIELLVVIAIIAILSAIVITSLAPAQKKAKVAAFQAEVRSAAADFVISCDDDKLNLTDSSVLSGGSTKNVDWDSIGASNIDNAGCGDQSGVFSVGPIRPVSGAVNCEAKVESGTVIFSDPCTYQ
ncbi:prepilin-type N-terminal cleavage/methylation domain-containing protein [Candidatus Nomurabacteria bacterium]|nr:prepilin-type N-terminal cleavage/methylation domain-containing protein [Candidatus Nomurabacteria bacterium]